MTARFGEPVNVPLDAAEWPLCVYRLWAADGSCLYVGQTRQAHPAMRIMSHRRRNWGEVVRADYIQLESGADQDDLDQLEREQIQTLQPRFNQQGVTLPLPALPSCPPPVHPQELAQEAAS
jgi:hypothetical protein